MSTPVRGNESITVAVNRNSISETRPLTETRLSSFDGEGTTAGNDWAALNEEEGTGLKRVMIIVDHSKEAKQAMLYALSHVVKKEDTVTLLHVLPAQKSSVRQLQGNLFSSGSKEPRSKLESRACELAVSLKMMCKSRRPEVEIEQVILEGEKGPTIVAQAKKLGTSILVLGQRRPSLLQRLIQRKNDALVDYCIQNAECLAIAVRKKSKSAGGYLINSRLQKNFWLLA